MKITVDKALIEQAIEAIASALSDDQPYIVKCAKAGAALRAALAEPAVEPVAWMVRNGLVDYQLMGSKTQADALAAEMQKRHDLSGSWSAFRVHPLYTSPPPPAEVPLLGDEEIENTWPFNKTSSPPYGFARAIEAAVRQKAGL